MHSLVTGNEFGDMFASQDLENENFASPSAKQNEEAAREDLRERQERRRSLNDAWIVRIIEYYRDTKADPGGRGIRGLKEIIEERGLDAGPITQFKQAEAMLSQAYEDSDCERLPQMGEPITLEDGQVSMFIPPDIMEPEMLLAYAEKLADLAEQSAGRHKLIQFKELIEGLSALRNDENAGMSSAAIASLRGTVIYWQDVVLNHFEKAEKQRIMGLS